MADWRRRLALQEVESHDHFSEAVLRLPASLYTNRQSAGPEAVRRVDDRSSVWIYRGDQTVRVPVSTNFRTAKFWRGA